MTESSLLLALFVYSYSMQINSVDFNPPTIYSLVELPLRREEAMFSIGEMCVSNDPSVNEAIIENRYGLCDQKTSFRISVM